MFGRFSDHIKNQGHYRSWDLAITAFEQEDLLTGIEYFLHFLTTEEGDNVSYVRGSTSIDFQFFQGSKKLVGRADHQKIRVEGKIASCRQPHAGLLRRLLEENYLLKYSRYCLDEDADISIVFDSFSADASPYKLYFGLKELALAADKQDDLLIEEFEQLLPVNTGHTSPLPEGERQAKVHFIRSTLSDALNVVRHPHFVSHASTGAASYVLLAAIYKIDFLVHPEGFCLEAFERMHNGHFANDGRSQGERNREIIRYIDELLARSDQQLGSELYSVISTFGLLGATNLQQFAAVAEAELVHFDWYYDRGLGQVAQSIAGYVVGYGLYSFSLPVVAHAFLLLFYRVTEYQFFEALGFDDALVDANGRPRKKEIVTEIRALVAQFRPTYPNLEAVLQCLVFDDMPLFSRSYITMVCQLDLSK